MAVAKTSNSSEQVTQPCNCYKVETLTETILDANQTSNLKDRYILGEQLGWGQFGIIRVCSDKLTGEVLACKSIGKDRLVTSDDVRSVKLEIEIMSKLSGHPNVVDLKAVYEEEDYVHLVMELCAGGELFHLLEKHGRFSESQARVRFRHLMQVVLYCHENGVVHRDLKPENILLATKASSSPIKLADFGLATYIKPGTHIYLVFFADHLLVLYLVDIIQKVELLNILSICVHLSRAEFAWACWESILYSSRGTCWGL